MELRIKKVIPIGKNPLKSLLVNYPLLSDENKEGIFRLRFKLAF